MADIKHDVNFKLTLDAEGKAKLDKIYQRMIQEHLFKISTKPLLATKPSKDKEEEDDCYLEEEVELCSKPIEVEPIVIEEAIVIEEPVMIEEPIVIDEEKKEKEEGESYSSESSESSESFEEEESDSWGEDDMIVEEDEVVSDYEEEEVLSHRASRKRAAPKTIYNPCDSFDEARKQEREAEKTARDIGAGKLKYALSDLQNALSILRRDGIRAFCQDRWAQSMFPFISIQRQCGYNGGNGASEHFEELYRNPHHYRVVDINLNQAKCCFLCGLQRRYTSGVVHTRTGEIFPMGGFCATLAISVIDLAGALIKASRGSPSTLNEWKDLWKNLHHLSTIMQTAHANKTKARAPRKVARKPDNPPARPMAKKAGPSSGPRMRKKVKMTI